VLYFGWTIWDIGRLKGFAMKTKPLPRGPFASLREAAVALGCSVETVRRRFDEGKLKGIHDTHRRVYWTSVDAYVKTHSNSRKP
jgi:excisionase family DNA binding protein